MTDCPTQGQSAWGQQLYAADSSVSMQVERTILCPASEYQKHLSGLVMQGLPGSSGAQQPKARSVSNSVMELRNICNHPFLVRLA